MATSDSKPFRIIVDFFPVWKRRIGNFRQNLRLLPEKVFNMRTTQKFAWGLQTLRTLVSNKQRGDEAVNWRHVWHTRRDGN